MRKWISKNSRKGLTLPVAMAVGIFLVLIASSLLFIAINSTSRTGADVSGRQAYLNVRSALEYARAYYNSCEDLSSVGDAEYMIMTDVGGTTAEGATISKNIADTDNAVTYVIAQYTEPQDSNPATLKLSAFSKYSDPFGNRFRSARLSVTFTVGSSAPTRYTPFTIPGSPPVAPEDKITLHVKQPKDMNYQLSYYVWTYNDAGHAYDSYIDNKLEETTNVFEWYPSSVSAFNTTTTKDNIVRPNGQWATGTDGKQGPPAIMATTSDDDLWTTGSYVVKKGRVPWFNIIFAQKGSVLDGGNIYNSQTNEMFHLWYLDPNDKNVYFEFTGKTRNDGHKDYITKYYEGKAWDGRQGLEYESDENSTNQTTALVYIKNQKTTVHFRIKGKDDRSTVPSISAPVITYVKNRDGTDINTGSKSYLKQSGNKENSATMQYEGCGWWVANVETNKEFNISISAQDYLYENIAVKPNSESEAWLILMNGTVSAHQTEAAALDRLHVDSESYVTVHAKIANYNKPATPTLSYKNVGTNSSAGKIKLQNKVIEASQINSVDYTTESYNTLATRLNEAIILLSDNNFINSQEGDTYEEKMTAADIVYDQKRDAITSAVNGLVPRGVTAEQLAPLESIIKKSDDLIKVQEQKGIYDYAAYQSFTSSTSPYTRAKAAYNDVNNLTSTLISAYVTELTESYNDLNENHKLNRGELAATIEEAATLIHDDHYKLEPRQELDKVLNGDSANPTVPSARAIYEQKFISQTVLDQKTADLVARINVVKSSLEVPLDVAHLEELISTAQAYLDANQTEKRNCTDESYNALQQALENANSKVGSIKFQEDVTAIEQPLDKAVNEFTVTKPQNSNDMLAQGRKLNSDGQFEPVSSITRVFIITEATYPFELSQYTSVSDGQPTAVSHLNMSLQNETGYYYYDIDKEIYSALSLTVTKLDGAVDEDGNELPGEEITSEKYLFDDIPDNNIAFRIAPDGKITKTQMTAVYFPRFEGVIDAKVGTAEVKPVYESPYFVFRYEATDQRLQVSFTTTGPDGNPAVKMFQMKDVLPAGDYIAKTDGTNLVPEAIDVRAVYPKLIAEPTEPPTPQPTVATDSDYEIAEMGNFKGFNFGDINVPDGQTCIVASPNNGNVLKGEKPRIYAWTNEGDQLTGPWDNNPCMTQYKSTDYYYYLIPANVNYIFITKGASNEKITDKICIRGGAHDYTYEFYKIYLNPAPKAYKKEGYDYSDRTGTTVDPNSNLTETFDAVTFDNTKTCILLHAIGNLGPLTNGNQLPMIYCWGGATGSTIGAAWPGQLMQRYGETKYYYHIVDAEVKGVKLNYQDGTDFSGGGDENNIVIRETSDKFYKYIILEPGSGTRPNVTKLEYAPEIEVPVSDVPESEMDGTELPLRYVGGNKVRITNRPYYEIYGSGQKTNDYGYPMNDGNYMYGGDQINNNSGGRVGAAKLSAYFDWYEVKLPIPKSAKYTFELKGMNPDTPNRKTVQINDIYGDVWLSQLDNTTVTSDVYSNVDLLSFNLENDNIPENLTVYFKMPTGWSNLSYTAHGTGSNVSKTVGSGDHLTRGTNTNIYYIKNLTKKTPYFTFTVTDSAGEIHTYNTSLAGGDYLMFDPLYNGGYGGWREFISDNDRLKLVLRDIMADYYGHVIVNVYDKNGEVVSVGTNGADTYYYSYFLWKTVTDDTFFHYAETGTASDCAYQMDMSKIEGFTEAKAYDYYTKLKVRLDAYRELYQQLAIARKFIETPLMDGKHGEQSSLASDGKYPEYVARKDYKKYSAGFISTLKSKYKSAETAYLDTECTYDSSSSYLNTILNETKKLKRAIANSDVSSEGSIGCLLYDAQSKVEAGSTFKIRYRETKNGEFTTVPVPERNPENYPIIFIVPNNTKGIIYDVQFIECTITGEVLLNPKKDMMTLDDDIEWVFFDSNNAFWTPNSSTDYRQINNDVFVQEEKNEVYTFDMHKAYKKVARKVGDQYVRDDDGEIIYDKQEITQDGKTKYESMTLLFTYDADVYKWKSSTQTQYFYTIKAGAYTFKDGYTAPVSNGKIDLFSDAAKNYFSNSNNFGKYVDNAVDAVTDLGWHNGKTGGDDGDGVFKTGYNATTNRNVNFDVSSGDFLTYGRSYNYYTSEGLCFRWSSEQPLYTATTPVILQAGELRISSMGTIDGTKNGARDPQFLLKSKDPTATKMMVTFLTDVNVKYDDSMGGYHQFSIREGTYVIEKENEYDDYIANIYNETYWKSMEHVHPVGVNTNASAGVGSSKLQHGTYGR